MENFYEELKSVQTLEESIGKAEMEHLVNHLVDGFECESDAENYLTLFFSLNSKDVEIVLERLRAKSILVHTSDKIGSEFLKKNEMMISKMVKLMNSISMKEHNKPFHLAAALGQLELSEKTIESFNINIQELFNTEDIKSTPKGNCPTGHYPLYVSYMAPWKLRWSFNIETRRKISETRCQFQHGPFNGVIKGWFSFSGQVMIMVLLQGWGFKLAANNNHFFYKWWFVFVAGLTPFTCQIKLMARKY